MPGQAQPPWDQFRQQLSDLEGRLAGVERQQQMVLTDPTGASGDPEHGFAVMVTGSLQAICGISAFGCAVWTGSAWVQVPSSGLRVPLGLGQAADGYRSAAFSLTAGATTVIPIDTSVRDPGGNLDVTTNHRYDVPAAGDYLVAGGILITSTATSQRATCQLLHNGTAFADAEAWSSAAGQDLGPAVSRIVHCAAGDTIQLAAFSGQALALSLVSAANFLSVIQLA